MIFTKIIPFKISNIFTPFKTSESRLGIYSVQLNTQFLSAFCLLGIQGHVRQILLLWSLHSNTGERENKEIKTWRRISYSDFSAMQKTKSDVIRK